MIYGGVPCESELSFIVISKTSFLGLLKLINEVV